MNGRLAAIISQRPSPELADGGRMPCELSTARDAIISQTLRRLGGVAAKRAWRRHAWRYSSLRDSHPSLSLRSLRCAVLASRKPRVAIVSTRATHASRPWRAFYDDAS
jgi:hypothetical protein